MASAHRAGCGRVDMKGQWERRMGEASAAPADVRFLSVRRLALT